MDELTFRASLSKEELERRAYIIPFKVYEFSTLELLNKYSEELEKTWDELINAAIVKFMGDIEVVRKLRE